MKEFILFSVQHVINTSLDKGAESFFLCRCHFGCINRCAEFDGYRLLLNLWNMGFENIFCIFYGDGNDRTAGFGRNLKSTVLKWKHFAAKAPRAFRKEEDGGSLFD